MTMDQVIANLIAAVAIVISVLTWFVDRRRGKRNEARQNELDDSQAALKQRQLIFDEKMLAFAREIRQRADVRVRIRLRDRGGSKYQLKLRNAGNGPALGVQARVEGYITDPSSMGPSLLDTGEQYAVVMTVPEHPIGRLDADSQDFVLYFDVDWPGFSDPVFLTLTWYEIDRREKQEKALQLTIPNFWDDESS